MKKRRLRLVQNVGHHPPVRQEKNQGRHRQNPDSVAHPPAEQDRGEGGVGPVEARPAVARHGKNGDDGGKHQRHEAETESRANGQQVGIGEAVPQPGRRTGMGGGDDQVGKQQVAERERGCADPEAAAQRRREDDRCEEGAEEEKKGEVQTRGWIPRAYAGGGLEQRGPRIETDEHNGVGRQEPDPWSTQKRRHDSGVWKDTGNSLLQKSRTANRRATTEK